MKNSIFVCLGVLCALSRPASAAVVITNGTDWVPFRFENTVKAGSLLDFSEIVPSDRPAGARHGRLVPDAQGHLIGEKSGERVRLVGVNLNFDANFMDRETVDRLAKHLSRLGYNAVRLHHTDVLLMQGGWNSGRSDRIDPKMLDRLDYTFAAMKREGLYLTTDLYQMRRTGADELPSLKVKKGLDWGQLKGLLPICDDAFQTWCRFARQMMTHVNPYTKLAWKDDPSLSFIVAVNEDSIMSICGNKQSKNPAVIHKASERFETAFGLWQNKNAEKFELEGELDAREAWFDFLIEKGAGIQRKYGDFLNGTLGYRGLVSGANWWDVKFSAFERNELGIVDNHGYADHPQQQNNYTAWNQRSDVQGQHPAYVEPIMKAPSRIFGKPMAITEWQFCMPNRYRAESGPMMGAYSAFQDWDATFRFAWSHSAENCREQKPMSAKSWFDIASDPLNQISDRLNVLLFRRGDVSPAKERHVYAVTREDVMNAGMGDMWQKGLFPLGFTSLAFVHAIGSQVLDAKHPARTDCAAVYSADKPKELPKFAMGDMDRVSDTGELVWSRKGRFTVSTPRSEVVLAYPKGEPSAAGYVAGGLAVRPVEKFQMVSASSLDGKSLRQSKKVLFVHLSNMYNHELVFDQPNLHCVKSWGHLPYLVESTAAEVTFASAVAGLELLALRFDGTPIRREKTTYAKGAYHATLAISPTEEAVAYYALVAPGTLKIDTTPPPPLKGLPIPHLVTITNEGKTPARLKLTPGSGCRLREGETSLKLSPGESRAVEIVSEVE